MNREIQTAPDLVDELDRLEKQLANYRHVVEQQETIIQVGRIDGFLDHARPTSFPA